MINDRSCLLTVGFLLFLFISDPVAGLSTSNVDCSAKTTLENRSCDRRRAFLQSTAFLLSSLTQPSVAAYLDPNSEMPKITQQVYLDVEIDQGKEEKKKGRLVIGLFGELMPRTTQNFETLAKDNAYAGTTFYRVLSDFSIQGGAIGDPTGKTGKSAYGEPFEPDNFNLKHTKAGLVSAVRGIGGAIDSRFFINCLDDAGWADDRYAAFGIVQEGMDFVKEIEKVNVKPPQNKPTSDVTIVASGLL